MQQDKRLEFHCRFLKAPFQCVCSDVWSVVVVYEVGHERIEEESLHSSRERRCVRGVDINFDQRHCSTFPGGRAMKNIRTAYKFVLFTNTKR